jgi:hypothetical protein
METLITIMAAQVAAYATPELAKLLKSVSESKNRKLILQCLSALAAGITATVAYLQTGDVSGLGDFVELFFTALFGFGLATAQYFLSKANHKAKSK